MEPDPNRYSWDRTGTPDPELQRWEDLLGRFSHAEAPGLVLPPRISGASGRWRYWLAAAACLLIAAAIGLHFAWQFGQNWKVAALSGAPLLDRRPVNSQ